MPTSVDTPRSAAVEAPRSPWRTVAVAASALIAGVYLLIFAGVLSVGRAEAGDLGILGVAGGVFVVMALLLWRVRSRLLWAGVAGLQLMLTAMYVAVAPERDPSFEVWGLTIRILSVVLFVAVVAMLLGSRKDRIG
jgi:hypothetical protein